MAVYLSFIHRIATIKSENLNHNQQCWSFLYKHRQSDFFFFLKQVLSGQTRYTHDLILK